MKKIVIEITDDDYNRINSYPDGKTFFPITARLYKAVKDGTPLDKIRTEIEGYKSTIDNAISEDELKIEGMKEAYTDCLEIIDKYRGNIK